MVTDHTDYSDVFNCLPDAVCIIDIVGNVITSNSAFKKTIVDSFSCVNFVTDLIHAQHLEKYDSIIQKLLSNHLSGVQECLQLGTMKTLTMPRELESCES